MKHIKTINEIFGRNEFLGPKDGDKFANELMDIIEKENIKIEQNWEGRYFIELDDDRYSFKHSIKQDGVISTILTMGYGTLVYFIYINDKPLRISLRTYMRIEKLFKKQKSNKIVTILAKNYKDSKIPHNLEDLPNLSDEGRTAKKYNL